MNKTVLFLSICIVLSAFPMQRMQNTRDGWKYRSYPTVAKSQDYAEEEKTDKEKQDKSQKEPIVLQPGYNAPARIDTQNIGLWLTVHYMYAIAEEKGLSIGDMYSNTPTQHQGKVIDLDYDYKSAFQIGLGVNTYYDDWRILFEYLRYHSSNDKSQGIKPNMAAITTYWFETSRNASYVKGKWKLHIDLLDALVGRPCYVGKRLIFNPQVGLVGGWLDQKYNINYTVSSFVPKSKNKSDSWLIGPKAKLDTSWFFYPTFQAFADIGFSMFYQRFTVTAKQDTYNNPAVLAANFKDKKGQINSSLQMILGLGWGSYLSQNRYHLSIKAGYEFQVFFEQNMMRYLNDMISARTGASPGDLYLHGLNLSARFDF